MPIITVFAPGRIAHAHFPEQIGETEINGVDTICIRISVENGELGAENVQGWSDELAQDLPKDTFLIMFVGIASKVKMIETILAYSDLILVHQSDKSEYKKSKKFELPAEIGLKNNEHNECNPESYYYVFSGDNDLDSNKMWDKFKEIMKSISEGEKCSEILELLSKFLKGFGIKHRISLLDQYAAWMILGEDNQEIRDRLNTLIGREIFSDLSKHTPSNEDIGKSMKLADREMSKLLLLLE